MHNEFTAIIERDGKWFVAYCPEIPGANGQGKTRSACLKSLSEAIDLIRDDDSRSWNHPMAVRIRPPSGSER